MAKKQFKAESRRLLDLMINSIYTNQEIFLREVTVARAEPSFDCASVSGYIRRNLYRRIGIDSSPPIILVEFVRYIHSANQLFQFE